MEIAFALLSQFGEIGKDGLLCLFNAGFDTMQCSEFPATAPPFFIAGKFILSPEEARQPHTVLVEMSGAEGEWVQSGERKEINVIPNRANPDWPSHSTIFVQMNVTFPRPGEFSVRVWFDDTPVKTLSLHIIEAPKSG